MPYTVTVMPSGLSLQAQGGEDLLSLLRRHGLAPESPCGGRGRCGKCVVRADGEDILSCCTTVDRNMTVTLPTRRNEQILRSAATVFPSSGQDGYLAAFDIGSTTVVCYLLDGKSGRCLADAGTANPQKSYGADVISRLNAAVHGQLAELQGLIRESMEQLLLQCCTAAGVSPEEITILSVVANPAMQQIFLGLDCANLIAPPFAPVIKEPSTVPAGAYFPMTPNAKLLIVPDIAGYVGADTVACALALHPENLPGTTLLADIGTNGELLLYHNGRIAACSAAAGPALEGAGIRFGMRAADGAIDKVWTEDGTHRCHVIGGGEAVGICGSGLADAAAAALSLELMDSHGRITSPDEKDGQRFIPLTDTVYLTQDDIRQLQLAKGAIAAGIELLAGHLGAKRIDNILLAGAFGSFLDPHSACAIGLLPPDAAGRVRAVGNAAGSGARLLACQPERLEETRALLARVEFVELASLPDFQYIFAENMFFPEDE